jgi:hypothetical protein
MPVRSPPARALQPNKSSSLPSCHPSLDRYTLAVKFEQLRKIGQQTKVDQIKLPNIGYRLR